MSEPDAVIRVRGLITRFGRQTIHDGLDLDIRRGEVIGVVGGSGTGKSVLMRSIVGLQTPIEGSIEVFGENTIGREETEAVGIRKRWGVLFQGGALFSTLTVAENVQVPIKEFYPGLDPALTETVRRIQVLGSALPPASSRERVRTAVQASVRQQMSTGKETPVFDTAVIERPVARPGVRQPLIAGSGPASPWPPDPGTVSARPNVARALAGKRPDKKEIRSHGRRTESACRR